MKFKCVVPHDFYDQYKDMRYQKYFGKSGAIWYLGHRENCADYIYCSNERKEGFYGQTVKFPLVHGETDEVVGPWHSNASSFYSDTGVDVCDRSRTFGCIGKNREPTKGFNWIINNIVYLDDGPRLGIHGRIEALAKTMAKKLGQPLAYWSVSQGGSVCGIIDKNRNYT
jgi:hypothetical protein